MRFVLLMAGHHVRCVNVANIKYFESLAFPTLDLSTTIYFIDGSSMDVSETLSQIHEACEAK